MVRCSVRRGRDALQEFGGKLLTSHVEDENSHGRLASLLLSNARDADARTRARDDLGNNIAVGGHQMMTSFCWTLVCLCENPAIQDELRLSLRSGPADPIGYTDNELLGWVVRESLRLYPPFYLIPRVATRDVEIGGFRIVKGELVLVSPWVTQRSAIYYSDPDEFRPERWRGKSDEASRFEYFPFGGGPRECVASSIIPPLLSVAIASLVRNHRIDRVDSDPIVPLAGLSLSLSRPLVVRLDRID